MSGPQEQVKYAVDVAAVSVTGAALMEWLPPLAAALTVIWTAIRIYETKTVRHLCRRIRYGRAEK